VVNRTVALWKKLGSARRPVGLMILGLALVVADAVLAGVQIGDAGARPGGGGILLIGTIFVGSGLIAVTANRRRRDRLTRSAGD
jgi:hypothetical protein